MTSWPSLKTDITNAGDEWVDERVVVDGNLITSRNPSDIPAFNSALLEAVNYGGGEQHLFGHLRHQGRSPAGGIRVRRHRLS